MIDQVITFGKEPSNDEVFAFTKSLGDRFKGAPVLLADSNENFGDVRRQIEMLPKINYRTDKVIAILGGDDLEALRLALTIVHRKSSFKNVIIASRIEGNTELDQALLLETSRIPRLVLASGAHASAWKDALDNFDATHPGWDE